MCALKWGKSDGKGVRVFALLCQVDSNIQWIPDPLKG